MSNTTSPVAWVTGGGTGIGRGIVHALCAQGYTVFASGRRAEPLQEAASSSPGPGRVAAAVADVTSETDLSAVVSRIRSEHGQLDVLVLCAGVNVPDRSIESTSSDQWRTLLDVNATGAFLTLKAALPLLRAAPAAIVFTIASVAGLRALQMAGAGYVASKYATRGLGAFAGAELAREGIRMTVIYPGEVNTPILDKRDSPPDEDARRAMVQPQDIGRLVVSVLSLPQTTHVPELVVKPLSQLLI